jgi:hypothetical protein
MGMRRWVKNYRQGGVLHTPTHTKELYNQPQGFNAVTALALLIEKTVLSFLFASGFVRISRRNVPLTAEKQQLNEWSG